MKRKSRVIQDSTRRKLSLAKLGNQNAKGKHKSSPRKFAYICITNGEQMKHLMLGVEIPKGWWQGRTMTMEHRRKLQEHCRKINATTNIEKTKEAARRRRESKQNNING